MYKMRLLNIEDIDIRQPVAKACLNKEHGKPHYIKTGIVSEIEKHQIVVTWQCGICLSSKEFCVKCEKQTILKGNLGGLRFAPRV